ncbi:MAG: hypothetical protein D6714_21690 [Bacteroidetes bacterium]|nr:MAG: hypothetical protein D6714_21690 [Bacteroidota bacterium]
MTSNQAPSERYHIFFVEKCPPSSRCVGGSFKIYGYVKFCKFPQNVKQQRVGMKRRTFSPEFKVKVVLEALKERNSLRALSRKYDLSPSLISQWKKKFLEGVESVFEQEEEAAMEAAPEDLLKTIERLKAERDFLKNALDKIAGRHPGDEGE